MSGKKQQKKQKKATNEFEKLAQSSKLPNNQNEKDDNDDDDDNENMQKEINIISEEIQPDDTVFTFYNRVQNAALDILDDYPDKKFLLVIRSLNEELDDSQLKIISDSVPPNYNIPLISQPIFISVGFKTLPPLKLAKLIDGGFNEIGINVKNGISYIKRDRLTVIDEDDQFFKRDDDPILESNDPNFTNGFSYILTSARYNITSISNLLGNWEREWNILVEQGFITKDQKLTQDGNFASEFEDLLFYEYVIMIKYMKIQNENDKVSAFLFSLLIFQIIRHGDQIINDYYSESFLNNFDERSDLVTVIKTLFPLLKFDKEGASDGSLNSKEKYLREGLNPFKSEVIVNFLIGKFRIYINNITELNNEDNDDVLYDLYCDAINKLGEFISDLYSRINELIEVIKENLPEFYKKHVFSFYYINDKPTISIEMESTNKNYYILKNRPGWHCYSIPNNVFAFYIICYENETKGRKNAKNQTIVEGDNKPRISFIHSMNGTMKINSIEIEEELDNVFANAITNSIIETNLFHPIIDAPEKEDFIFAVTTTVRENKSFLSYIPQKEQEKKCKNEIQNAISLLKIINPFLPNSLIVFNNKLSLYVELQLCGLSNIHSRVYSIQQKKKNSKGKSKDDADIFSEAPFCKAPYAYNINKQTIEYLWNNINELKGYSPPLRIALASNDFMNFGNSNEDNKSPFIKPKIYANCNSVFFNASNLVILSDIKRKELGAAIKLHVKLKPKEIEHNFLQTLSMIVPESCKIVYNECMVMVNNQKSSIIAQFKSSEDRDLLVKALGDRLKEICKVKSNDVTLKFKPLKSFCKFIDLYQSSLSILNKFPENVTIESKEDDSDVERFKIYNLNDQINEKLGIEEGDRVWFTTNPYLAYVTFPKDKKDKIDDVLKEITSSDKKIAIDLSKHYNIITFVFPVQKNMGINLKERYNSIEKNILPKIKPFLTLSIDNVKNMGEIKVYAENAAFETAILIAKLFKNEQLTKAFEIEYPHPALKTHQGTQEAIDNWITANNNKMKKIENEWVGNVVAVDELTKQFKIDLENEVFRFEYAAYYVPPIEFTNIREEFDKNGFLDYGYDSFYEVLIIRPSDYELFDLRHKFVEKNENSEMFCLKKCKGSIPYKKRLSIYEIGNDNVNTKHISFCKRCASVAVKERTKDYFCQDDIMNNQAKIVFPSRIDKKELETKFRTLDLFSGRYDNYSVPIGQFLWYLSELSDQKLNNFIRAWVNMAADVAVFQSPMITFCPNHFGSLFKLSENSGDVIKCKFNGNCENCFHIKSMKWYNHPSDEKDKGKSKSKDKDKDDKPKPIPIGFNHTECPECEIPTFNLFNNVIMFCDRCGCIWCYLCKIKLDREKVLRHVREFHNGRYNI